MSKQDYNVILDVEDPNIGTGDTQDASKAESDTTSFVYDATSAGRIGQPTGTSRTSSPFRGGPATFSQPVEPTSTSVLSTAHYTPYFRITTSDVLERLKLAFLPTPQFRSSIETNPDLYGPIWTVITLAFVLFVTSSVGVNGKAEGVEKLSAALAVCAIYAWGMPVVVWAGCGYAGVKGVRIVELVTVYGYGMGVWIAVAVICIAPFELVRWVTVLIAAASSAVFLLRNTLALLGTNSPTLPGFDSTLESSSDKISVMRVVYGVMVVFHLVWVLVVKILFLGYTWSIFANAAGGDGGTAADPGDAGGQ